LNPPFVGDPDFGRKFDARDFLVDSLNKLPKSGSVDGRMMLQDLYETQIGIFNHLGQSRTRPFSSVAMLPGEDVNENSLLMASMRLFVEKNISAITGYNFTEFMDLPTDVIRMWIDVINESTMKKAQTLNDVTNDLQRAAGRVR
jgi:hypothetical protein